MLNKCELCKKDLIFCAELTKMVLALKNAEC